MSSHTDVSGVGERSIGPVGCPSARVACLRGGADGLGSNGADAERSAEDGSPGPANAPLEAVGFPPSNRGKLDPPSRIDLEGDVPWGAGNEDSGFSDPPTPQFLGLAVDRLRLSGFLAPGVDGSAAIKRVMGLHRSISGAGRRIGPRDSKRHRAWDSESGTKGGVYYQIDEVDGWPSTATVEWNPALAGSWVGTDVARWFRHACGCSRVWVRRVDSAFDFKAPRWSLLLDAGNRVVNRLGCSPGGGCETEQAGVGGQGEYRFTLYDKERERAKKGDNDPRWVGVCRFEQRWYPSAEDAPDAVELASIVWPDHATVRRVMFNPDRVQGDEQRLLLKLAVTGGMAVVRPELVRSLNRVRRVQMLECLLPEIDPSPRQLFARHWAETVERDCGLLLEGLRCSSV